ncbi:Uncharacterised protein [Mycobacteroides abscessus subsp. massiliense]|nr:Uncharacterised protein [Mycobacteroides abscessus subsp. massiliense]
MLALAGSQTHLAPTRLLGRVLVLRLAQGWVRVVCQRVAWAVVLVTAVVWVGVLAD